MGTVSIKLRFTRRSKQSLLGRLLSEIQTESGIAGKGRQKRHIFSPLA